MALELKNTEHSYYCSDNNYYVGGAENFGRCDYDTWEERIKALLFGRVWLSVLSGRTQPPVWLSCCKTIFLKEGNNSENN